MLRKRDIDRLDWGAFAPDYWDDSKANAVYALPVLVGQRRDKARYARIATFVANIAVRGALNLPAGATQTFMFDVRGQSVSTTNLDHLRFEIYAKIPKAVSESVSIRFSF